MNSSISAKRSNITFFAVSVVVSASLLASGGYLLTSLLSGSKGKNTQIAEKSCISTLRANGFNPNISKSGEIKVQKARNTEIESLVYQSGVLIASCPAYTLTDYCAGADCPTPGVVFTLKHKELS